MPQFSYKAKSGPDQIKSGVIQAENPEAVARKLRQDGLFALSIVEVNPAQVKAAGGSRINSAQLSAFTRQLSNLVRSGFPLATALSTLSQQNAHPGLKRLIVDLHESIQKGSTFSQALSAYPGHFSTFYINMVQIGESSGKLDETLERLADFREKDDELRASVRSALTYPAFLLVTGILTLFVLMSFFIPRLVSMFTDMGQALPLPTQIIIQLSVFMNRFWWLIVLVIAALVMLVRAQYKLERSRLIIDRVLTGLPGIGAVIQRMEISRFAYALGVLLKNGVSMLEALKVVALGVDNRYLRGKIVAFPEQISKGKSLSNCFQSDTIFPAVLINMAAVGEESGNLTDMLFRIAASFEAEVSRTLKTVVGLIEPILILCIGGAVVVLVAAILLPIFQADFFAQ